MLSGTRLRVGPRGTENGLRSFPSWETGCFCSARAQVADEGSADGLLLLAGEAPPQDGEKEQKLFA